MKKQFAIKPLIIAIGLTLTFASQASDNTVKPHEQALVEINSANQIPTQLMQLETLPSELIFSDEKQLPELQSFLQNYVTMLEQGYVFNDSTAKRQFLQTKLALLLSQQDWHGALALIQQIRDLSEKAAAKQLTGIVPLAYAKAMLTAGSEQEGKFRREFQNQLEAALAEVDLSVARNEMIELLGRRNIMTENFLTGYAKNTIDDPAKMAKLKLPVDAIQNIVSFHRAVKDELPLRDIITSSLEKRLAESQEAVVKNLWEQRDFNLTQGESTLVAIWDTGIDTELQQDRMWRNPDESAINPFGIAYDEYFTLQSKNLLTRVSNYGDELEPLLSLYKGFTDQRLNKTTQAAKEFQDHVASLKPEEVGDFQTKLGEIGVYSHGQMVADVAAQKMQPIQLMSVMMSWPNMEIFKEKPLDAEYVAKLIAAAEESIAFMRKNGVRVANLSWRFTMPIFEESVLLSGTEVEPEKAKQIAKTNFIALNEGLTKAFASAPEILFIAGAGNEDENVEFVKSTPAGINLPNMITVGAVNSELQPTSFTSFGNSIDLYANGYQVPARMPGGMLNHATGTSIAAPLVTNLAAKIFSVQPELTPTQVIQIMQKHATLESEQQLPVVHPAATICALSPELSDCHHGKVAKVN